MTDDLANRNVGNATASTTTVSFRDAGVTLWGEAGEYVYDTYTELRESILPNLPETLPIVIGLVAYGHCLALTRGGGSRPAPRISVFSSLFKQGVNVVRDVLTHECLHADLGLNGLDPSHDSDDWYAAVRRLSPEVLGHDLDVKRGADRKSIRVPNPNYDPHGPKDATNRKTFVRKVRVEDAITLGDVARWPGSFRPAEWETGRVIECDSY